MGKSKKIVFLCFFTALIFILTSFLFSCTAKEKKEQSEVETKDSLESYIVQHSERAEEFQARISEIALKSALKENTCEALEKYIKEFSGYTSGKNTQYIDEAKTALKNLYFNEAKDSKSIELLQEFINKYENYDKVMSDEAADIIDDINWNAAYEEYKSKDILLPIKKYADLYPNSKYISEADKIIKKIQNDSSYSDKYLSEPTLDLIDEFLMYFPGHKDTEKALKLREDFVGDIYAMLQKGYISTSITGNSIMRSILFVRNNTNSKLIITVPLGIYLEADSGSVQNMLVREEKTFTVKSGKTTGLYINTACVNIFKDVPDKTNSFFVRMLQEDSPLIRLLKAARENKSSYEVIQAAVWQITDNPGKDKIINEIAYQDGQNAITEEVYNEALRLIEFIKTEE